MRRPLRQEVRGGRQSGFGASARTAAVRTVAAIVAALVAAAGFTLRGRVEQASAESTVVEIRSARRASFVPAFTRDRPLFLLVLGSDARRGERIERERADSIHIIGVDLKRRRATILGFPRDAYVEIPGHGKARINNALEVGGPPLVAESMEALTGMPIDFWMLTSFDGLKRMVDRIGGLTIDVPTEMHDPASGADFSPGPQHMTGREVLAFARDRHDLPNGDFDRSANHGRVLLAALAKLAEAFNDDPATLFAWMAAAWPQLRTDLGVGTLLDLALTATQVPVAGVNNLVVPGKPGFAGPASVVILSPEASAIYADMRADGVVDDPPDSAIP